MVNNDLWGDYSQAWNGLLDSVPGYQVVDRNTNEKVGLLSFVNNPSLRELFNHYDRESLRKATREYTEYISEHEYLLLSVHELVIFNFLNLILKDHYQLYNSGSKEYMDHLPISYFVYGIY